MAHLFDFDKQIHIPLTPHHRIGRLAKTVDTSIEKPYISKIHAVIEWTGQSWKIKNLGKNGTWVNGQHMSHDSDQTLNIADVIHFADLNDPGFRIDDISAPKDMLWPISQQLWPEEDIQPIYLEPYNLLPNAETPELVLFFDEHQQLWFSENVSPSASNVAKRLTQNSTIILDQQEWQFIRAFKYAPTETCSQQAPLDDFEFIFNVSLDEESIHLDLKNAQSKINFGVRTHHYLLLHLARQRVKDTQNGLDPSSQGWVYAEHLAKDLGLDLTHMNIQIFRARKQISDNLPTINNAQNLIERVSGKIRFGCEKIRIHKGCALTELVHQ